MFNKNSYNFPRLSLPNDQLAHLVIRKIAENIDFDIRVFVVAVVPKYHLFVRLRSISLMV